MNSTINEYGYEHDYQNETLDEDGNATQDRHENDAHEEQDITLYIFQHYKIHFDLIRIYLHLSVIIFGVIGNIINIIVMTRKDMVNPINAILTSLAISDMVVLVSILLQFILGYYNPSDYLIFCCSESYAWVLMALTSLHTFSISFNASSLLTIGAATLRVISLYYPTTALRFKNLRKVKLYIVLTYITSALIIMPRYFIFRIIDNSDDDTCAYWLGYSELYENNKFVLDTMNWLVLQIFKIVPSILLMVMTILLMRVINKANKNRKRLKLRSDPDRKRTTKILIVIVIIFILTTVPRAIVVILYYTKIYYGSEVKYLDAIFDTFQSTFELLYVFNCAVNFAIYYCLSGQFRATFFDIFIKPLKSLCCSV